MLFAALYRNYIKKKKILRFNVLKLHLRAAVLEGAKLIF